MAVASGAPVAVATPLDCAESECPSLDSLPPELLLEVVSHLDWLSLFCLERASLRCRDAVYNYLRRLRIVRVNSGNLGNVVQTVPELATLLTRLTALRELHVECSSSWMAPQDMLHTVAVASRCWPLLERLTMLMSGHYSYDLALLRWLCGNCKQLTEVTLDGSVDDQALLVVLGTRPGLRALHVRSGFPRGEFLARLPPELRRLTVRCRRLRSATVAQLARCRELRSLALVEVQGLRPEDLTTGLAGCARLERLAVSDREESVSACLPVAGLPTLRYLDLTNCCLTDDDLQQLLLRLPNLQSVCLTHCAGPTPHGLSLLGGLRALSSLSLVGTEGVSDWSLARLSGAPLTELQLGDGGVAFSASVTADGLLRLSQTCPTLQTLTLWADAELAESVRCGAGADERRLLEWLRVRLFKMVGLAMFAKVASVREWRHQHRRL